MTAVSSVERGLLSAKSGQMGTDHLFTAPIVLLALPAFVSPAIRSSVVFVDEFSQDFPLIAEVAFCFHFK